MYNHILFEADDGRDCADHRQPPRETECALGRRGCGVERRLRARRRRRRSIRAAIITGAGEKAFVAGADINELAVLSPVETREYGIRGQQTFRAAGNLRQADRLPR